MQRMMRILLLCVIISTIAIFHMSQVFASDVVDRIEGPNKSILLTIEDISNGGVFEKTLELLKKDNVKVVFFLYGEFISNHTDLVAKAVNDGHRLGNCGFKKEYWGEYSETEIYESLKKAEEQIIDITKEASQYMRPSYNAYTDAYYAAAARMRGKAIVRGMNLFQWTRPTNEALLAGLDDIKNGDVLNLNFSYSAAPELLPQIIATLRVRDFSFYIPEAAPKRPSTFGPFRVMHHAANGSQLVALTFDDGGEHANVSKILDVLQDHDVKATFFLLGSWMENNPDLVRRMVREGHEVGNHSYSHPRFVELSYDGMMREFGLTENIFKQTTGTNIAPLFRPPYGVYNNNVLQALKDKNYSGMVMWDVDTRDWSGKSADAITASVNADTRPGSVILFHLHAAHTLDALEQIIPSLKTRGLDFTTVSNLIA